MARPHIVIVGAGFGGTMITRVGSDRAALLRAGTAAEVALAAVALVLAALSGDPGVSHGTTHIVAGAFGPAVTDALAAVLATAMGIQNAVARKLAVPDLTTTVLTMTLTGIGADFRAVVRRASAPGGGETRQVSLLQGPKLSGRFFLLSKLNRDADLAACRPRGKACR